MSIYGTCGHDITDLCGPDGDWGAIIVSRLDKQGDNVASYESVCRECRAKIIAANCHLANEDEATQWMRGELGRAVW